MKWLMRIAGAVMIAMFISQFYWIFVIAMVMFLFS